MALHVSKVVRAIAATPLKQTRTYFEHLYGGVVARLFLSTQHPIANPGFHNHEGEQFIVALEGESQLESIRGQNGKGPEHHAIQTVRAGDVVLLAAQKPHRWITPRGELLALAIDLCSPSAACRAQNPARKEFESLVEIILGPGEPETVHGLLKHDDAFAKLLRAYRREAEMQRPGMHTRVGALCAEMLVLIARKRANAPSLESPAARSGAHIPARLSPQHYVERAREYLQADYRRDIALPQLAERMGLSITHLHRLFVEQLHAPPMAYLRKFRMERASELLTQTSRPVREIARDVGYPEAEQFSKVFRRAYGCSPREYRQSALRNAPAL